MRIAPFFATSAIALVAAAGLTGCSSSSVEPGPATSHSAAEKPEAPQPVDLDGTWKQTNSQTEDSYQQATIADGVIQVDWVADGGDTTSIYWIGTVTLPGDDSQSFTWDSERDKEKTDNALLASHDDTKTFTYTDGEISYKVTALGTTTTVRLGRE